MQRFDTEKYPDPKRLTPSGLVELAETLILWREFGAAKFYADIAKAAGQEVRRQVIEKRFERLDLADRYLIHADMLQREASYGICKIVCEKLLALENVNMTEGNTKVLANEHCHDIIMMNDLARVYGRNYSL